MHQTPPPAERPIAPLSIEPRAVRRVQRVQQLPLFDPLEDVNAWHTDDDGSPPLIDSMACSHGICDHHLPHSLHRMAIRAGVWGMRPCACIRRRIDEHILFPPKSRNQWLQWTPESHWSLPSHHVQAMSTRTTLVMARSSDKKYIAISQGDHVVRIFNGNDFQLVGQVSHARSGFCLAFSPWVSSVLAVGYYDGTFIIWDWQQQTVLYQHTFDKMVSSVIFKSQHVLLISASGCLYKLNIETLLVNSIPQSHTTKRQRTTQPLTLNNHTEDDNHTKPLNIPTRIQKGITYVIGATVAEEPNYYILRKMRILSDRVSTPISKVHPELEYHLMISGTLDGEFSTLTEDTSMGRHNVFVGLGERPKGSDLPLTFHCSHTLTLVNTSRSRLPRNFEWGKELSYYEDSLQAKWSIPFVCAHSCQPIAHTRNAHYLAVVCYQFPWKSTSSSPHGEAKEMDTRIPISPYPSILSVRKQSHRIWIGHGSAGVFIWYDEQNSTICFEEEGQRLESVHGSVVTDLFDPHERFLMKSTVCIYKLTDPSSPHCIFSKSLPRNLPLHSTMTFSPWSGAFLVLTLTSSPWHLVIPWNTSCHEWRAIWAFERAIFPSQLGINCLLWHESDAIYMGLTNGSIMRLTQTNPAFSK